AESKDEDPKPEKDRAKTTPSTEEAAPSREGRTERVALSRIRQTIAEKMSESKTSIAETAVMDEVDVSKLWDLRNRHKDQLREEEIYLTFLPFIIKAAIAVLKEYPEFNTELDEENK